MVIIRKTAGLLPLPCLQAKHIRTHSIRRIDSILAEGLGTIIEEPEPLSPYSTIDAVKSSGENAGHAEDDDYHSKATPISCSRVTCCLAQGCPPSSKVSSVLSSPLSSIADFYVRTMFALMDRANLAELSVFNSGGSSTFVLQPAYADCPYRPVGPRCCPRSIN